jgi:hypothetical protein
MTGPRIHRRNAALDAGNTGKVRARCPSHCGERTGIGKMTEGVTIEMERRGDRDCISYLHCLDRLMRSPDPRKRNASHVCPPECPFYQPVVTHAEGGIPSSSGWARG